MAWLQTPPGVVLLWGVAFLSAVVLLVPALVFAIRSPRVRVEVTDEPNVVEPRGADPGYQSALAAFADMGFRPVGRIVESAWFFSPLRWHWRSQGATWLVAKDGKTFASIFKPRGKDRWMTSAMTLFADGGYVDTVSSKAGLQVLSGEQWRVELGDVEPAELIADHRRNVDDFGRERGVAVKTASFREAVGAMNAFQQRVLPRRRGTSVIVLAVLVMVALAPLLSAHGKLGWHHRPQPFLICISAALAVFVQLARRVRLRTLRTVHLAVVVVDLLIVLMVIWHRSHHHQGPLPGLTSAKRGPPGAPGARTFSASDQRF